MRLNDFIANKNLENIQKWMNDVSGGYQVYNPFVLPVHAKKDSLVYKKFIDLNYKNEDFLGKTVSDIGCCLGFFTFLSAYLGAKYCVGYDYNNDFLDFNNKIADMYFEEYPQLKDKILFKKVDLATLPNLINTDIILVNSILHWFFILNKEITMFDVIAWLHKHCNNAVYFEGCVDAEDPTLKKYGISPERCNLNLFLEESNKIFNKVEVVGDMTYAATRICVRLYKQDY